MDLKSNYCISSYMDIIKVLFWDSIQILRNNEILHRFLFYVNLKVDSQKFENKHNSNYFKFVSTNNAC